MQQGPAVWGRAPTDAGLPPNRLKVTAGSGRGEGGRRSGEAAVGPGLAEKAECKSL